MVTIRYTVCDRCGVRSTQEGVRIGVFHFGAEPKDLCSDCTQELTGVLNNSIKARLRIAAKAIDDLAEKLGDARAAELCGCSSSHLADTLRKISEGA